MIAEQVTLFAFMSLAAYRLWRLIGVDTITEPARHRLLLDRERRLNPTRLGLKLHDMITCPWCLGTWIAFGVVAVTTIWTPVAWPVLQAGAAASVVGWLGRRDEEDET